MLLGKAGPGSSKSIPDRGQRRTDEIANGRRHQQQQPRRGLREQRSVFKLFQRGQSRNRPVGTAEVG